MLQTGQNFWVTQPHTTCLSSGTSKEYNSQGENINGQPFGHCEDGKYMNIKFLDES